MVREVTEAPAVQVLTKHELKSDTELLGDLEELLWVCLVKELHRNSLAFNEGVKR